MSFWDSLEPRYRLILCDVWGVVHDGVRLCPGASERLTQWRGEKRCVVLLTNAPRPSGAVERQLEGIGLPRSAYDYVATSGEAGIEALLSLGRPVGFIGTAADREILEDRGVAIAANGDFADLACTGITEGKPQVGDYRPLLERLVDRDIHLHCLNPDRMVVRGGVPEACAGAIADLYTALGGRVTWYGKPYPAIYSHALQLAGDPSPDQVLAVGDGLQTDVLGAARMGFDTVFVTGGIHGGEPFPENFAAENKLGAWQPIAVVAGLT
jgi:HAD superfamily hydrolase (TIGR01459 family)